MSLSKINPKNTEAWKMLIKKREEIAGIQIIDLFDSSKNRIKKLMYLTLTFTSFSHLNIRYFFFK